MKTLFPFYSLAQKETPQAFTKTLTVFQKQFGRRYSLEISEKEAETVWEDAKKIVSGLSSDKFIRVNTWRFIKFLLDNHTFTLKHKEELWDFYLKTIFDSDGNIRNAGVHFLGRFYFALNCETVSYNPVTFQPKKVTQKQIEIRKFLVEKRDEIFQIHDSYFSSIKNSICDTYDCYQEESFIPLPEETEDKFLKTIRRGIYEFRADELIDKWGKEYFL